MPAKAGIQEGLTEMLHSGLRGMTRGEDISDDVNSLRAK
jgi:hypothetical protein